MENKITTKYGPGVYEVEYLPADSNVYTTFQMLHEGHRLWSLRNGVKLCGCYMPAKTKFKFSECPAGFWSAQVSEADRAQIRQLIGASGNLSIDQTRELVDLYSRVTGTTNRYTGCNACLEKMRAELVRFYEYPIDGDVKEAGAKVAARLQEQKESEKK